MRGLKHWQKSHPLEMLTRIGDVLYQHQLITNGKRLDSKNKQPFWIGRKDKEPFSMAGLFENWTDPKTGELIESCTIITQNAYSELSSIHTRMPIILPNEYTQYWLNAKQDDFPSIEMSAINFYPISKEVGSPKNDYRFKSLKIL